MSLSVVCERGRERVRAYKCWCVFRFIDNTNKSVEVISLFNAVTFLIEKIRRGILSTFQCSNLLTVAFIICIVNRLSCKRFEIAFFLRFSRSLFLFDMLFFFQSFSNAFLSQRLSFVLFVSLNLWLNNQIPY